MKNKKVDWITQSPSTTMPRRLAGDILIKSFYPCGKEVTKSPRDSEKYEKIHKKVCKECREAVTVAGSGRHATGAGNLIFSAHGGLQKNTTIEDFREQVKALQKV